MNNEMTTDNMSNEEVIEILKGIVFNGFDRTTPKERQALILAFKSLEERPQGKWKNVGFMICECNNCKEQFHELEANNYCPNCGAKMGDDMGDDIE